MTKSETTKIVKLLIMVFLMFGFRYLPPFGDLTPLGMHIFGIFIGCIFGWSVLDMVVPSILAIMSMSLLEGQTMAGIIASSFGNITFWMCLFLVMFVNVVERCGGTTYLATWFITRKFTKGRPVVLIFMFLLATFIVSMFNAIAAMFLFFSILYKICDQVGYKPYEKFSVIMILGITFSSLFGSNSIALIGSPLILANAFHAASGIALGMFDFLRILCPLGIFMMAVFSLSVKYVFRCDLTPLENADITTLVDMGALKVTKKLKIVTFFSLILAAGVILAALLPATMKLAQILNGMTIMGMAMILLCALSYIKVDGKNLFDFKEYAKSLPWDILMICAVVMPLASFLTMDSAGITLTISNFLGGFLSGLPTPVFIVTILLISVLLTNLGNNASMCILLMPVILSVGGDLGIDPVALYMVLIFTVQLAMLTPGACPAASIVWGSTDWVDPKSIYKYAPIMMVIFFLCIVLVGYPWATLMV